MCVHEFFSLYNILHDIFFIRKRYSQYKKSSLMGSGRLREVVARPGGVRVDCHGTWMSASIDKVE